MTKTDNKNTLQKIQAELKAPKGQYNSFGKYKYRSTEDIVEAAKPVLAKYDLALNLVDEIVNVGDRYYVKATAMLLNAESEVVTLATAFAREPESKKGMDESQITGATSSYARKYALNGLFAIDDTKDADATNEHKDTPKIDPVLKKKQEVVNLLKTLNVEYTPETVKDIIKDKTQLELSDENLDEIISRLKALVEEHAGA